MSSRVSVLSDNESQISEDRIKAAIVKSAALWSDANRNPKYLKRLLRKKYGTYVLLCFEMRSTDCLAPWIAVTKSWPNINRIDVAYYDAEVLRHYTSDDIIKVFMLKVSTPAEHGWCFRKEFISW